MIKPFEIGAEQNNIFTLFAIFYSSHRPTYTPVLPPSIIGNIGNIGNKPLFSGGFMLPFLACYLLCSVTFCLLIVPNAVLPKIRGRTALFK
jgi:hypothetical protein